MIIPVWNGEESIRGCLDALFRSSYRNFEVIVVDDGSTDSSKTVAGEYPCHVLLAGKAGAGAARNTGAKHARGDILFFLDADILVLPDSLANIVSIFERSPELDAVFGSFNKERVPWNLVSDYKNLLHHYTHQTGAPEAATFCGGFGAIRAARFFAIGGFNPRHRFLEDVEMGMRLHQAGMRVALKRDLQFTHTKRYTLASLIRSDLFGRAIPWTQLILSKRIFRNDLNTRTHNVLSVPISIGILLGLLLTPMFASYSPRFWVPAMAATAVLMLCLFWLNRRFVQFVVKERGARFTFQGTLLLWVGYLYSLLGIVIGAWLHFTSRAHEDSAHGTTCDGKQLPHGYGFDHAHSECGGSTREEAWRTNSEY